jgi:hypothetical protein
MLRDFGHFTQPALVVISLARGAAIGYGSPAGLREDRRAAEKHIRDMEQLAQQAFETTSGLPVPPPGANLLVPVTMGTWEEADAETWRWALRRTITDLVTKCREMVHRCWEFGPARPAATADEETLCKYNEAAQRALEECEAFEAKLGELMQRLLTFREQVDNFPRPGDQAPPLASCLDDLQASDKQPVINGQEGESSKSPRFGTWAFGLEADGRWHTFTVFKGRWEHRGPCCTTSDGLQRRLTDALAQGDGILSMSDADAIETEIHPGKASKERKRYIAQELSRFRAELRRAMGIVGGPTKSNDPLPYDDENRAWQARVEVGYAIEDDDGRLVFRKREGLTADEEIDRNQR